MKDLIFETNASIWQPAMQLLPNNMRAKKADVLGLTIALQESEMKHRHQIGGPAHGLWQFEKGGGVRGVLTHPMSAGFAKEIQQERGHGTGVNAAFEALEKDDIFAAAFARLLMWTDPLPLPEVEQSQRAWNFYTRVWRPGAYWNGSASKKEELRQKFIKNHTEVQKILG